MEPVSPVSSIHDPDMIRASQKYPDIPQPAPDGACEESIDVQSGIAALLHQAYEDFLVKKTMAFLQKNPGFQEITTLCNDEEVSSVLQVMRRSEAFTDWPSFLEKYSSIFHSMYIGRKGYIQIA